MLAKIVIVGRWYRSLDLVTRLHRVKVVLGLHIPIYCSYLLRVKCLLVVALVWIRVSSLSVLLLVHLLLVHLLPVLII